MKSSFGSDACVFCAGDGKQTHGPERFVAFTPLGGEVAKQDLERKVDQDGQGQVFLLQSLFEQFERSRGVVRGGPEFRHQMHEHEGLDICRAVPYKPC